MHDLRTIQYRNRQAQEAATKVNRALEVVKQMLADNRNPCNTFQGVLSQGRVRALNTLIKEVTQ